MGRKRKKKAIKIKPDEQLIEKIIRSYHSGMPIENIAEKLLMDKKEVQKIIDNWHNSIFLKSVEMGR